MAAFGRALKRPLPRSQEQASIPVELERSQLMRLISTDGCGVHHDYEFAIILMPPRGLIALRAGRLSLPGARLPCVAAVAASAAAQSLARLICFASRSLLPVAK